MRGCPHSVDAVVISANAPFIHSRGARGHVLGMDATFQNEWRMRPVFVIVSLCLTKLPNEDHFQVALLLSAAIFDGSHIPPHGPKGAGSKSSEASPEWQVVNRAKRKWASVWRPIANNAMSLEAMTTDPMYTSEVYKSVAVNETSVTGNEDSSEELKNAAPEDGEVGEVESGTDAVEFEEDWSQKWMLIENSL